MPEAANRKNLYRCFGCNGIIVTINRDEGVTPMFLTCRATEGCGDRMVSSLYRLPPDPPEPTWEWYSPSQKERRALNRAMREHVERGGLDLRQIKP